MAYTTEKRDAMVIEVEAPFYDDPKPPNGKYGEAYYQGNIIWMTDNVAT